MPFDRFAGSDSLLGPEMRSTGEVMGVAARLPGRVREGAGGGGRAAPAHRHGVPDRHRLRQGRRGRHRGAAARPRLRDRRDARDGGGDLAHGHPGAAAQQDRRGLAARGRLDRARRRRPRHQHPDRHRRAHRRLRDPRRGDRARHPVHHDAVRRDGGGARDRGGAARRAGGGVAARAPRPRLGGRAREPHARALRPAPLPGRRPRRGTAPTTSSRCSTRRARRRTRASSTCSPRASGGAGAPTSGPFLPRAFSVLRRHDDGRLDFLFEDVGPGTRRLCELRAGDGLWLLGPLGVGFRAPEDERRPLLVGGGVGIAPLAIWQDVARRARAARVPRRSACRGRGALD